MSDTGPAEFLKKIGNVLFSTRLTAVLLLVFAGGMAVGTFIENDYGTPTARALIYQAKWFEWTMILLGINFIGNIKKYRLFRRSKLPVLLFHIGFLITLLGAGITRYTGYEGIVRIREGASSNILISERQYLRVAVESDGESLYEEKQLALSQLGNNRFRMDLDVSGTDIQVESVKFVPSAVNKISAGEGEHEILNLVVAGPGGRQDIPIISGESIEISDLKLSFNDQSDATIQIESKEGELFLFSRFPVNYMVMSDQRTGVLPVDTMVKMNLRTLYRLGEVAFVPEGLYSNASLDWVTMEDKELTKEIDDVLMIRATAGSESTEITLRGGQGYISTPSSVELGKFTVSCAYGPKPILLPFDIFLRDFQLERYPGSQSPSAYASEVTIQDGQKSAQHRIFMNNVLDYDGYRFFQASYDSDEKGTVLSANHDFWGTQITYLGYFILGLGMLWTLFGRGSYFTNLNKRLRGIEHRRRALMLGALIFSTMAYGGADNPDVEDIKLGITSSTVPAEHAISFGELLVQDLDGRIKPVNSLSSEFLRKVAHRPYFKFTSQGETIKLNSDQAFIGMLSDPLSWQSIPVIYVHPRKGDRIVELIGGLSEDDYASFNDFIDPSGAYILQRDVALASQKKPGARSEYDKEVLKVDERFNILYNVFNARYLRIFPLPGDTTNTWYSPTDEVVPFRGEDSLFVYSILQVYFESLDEARASGDWSSSAEYLEYVRVFQQVAGAEVIPSTGRVKGELLYNILNLFFWLFQYYWTVGPILLIMALVRVFHRSRGLNRLWAAGVALAGIGFLAHGANLGLRWYVSGHAPWSDGYEMLIFVAWSLVLFGFVFTRRSWFALPLSVIFSGALLFVSYLDWLSPEITNLVPVLKSYWLKIHVATIVSSYAPLALACLLGFLALLLMIAKNRTNALRIDLAIDELTVISQMSMTIGLFMLTIGTFLGGVWANESWGRYWGWDPKETWALISVIVYAFVLHMRLIPGLRGKFALNVASVVAFSSIVMTSFGVNYYLAGLHSYAKGDPVPVPGFVYWVVAIIAVVVVLAWLKTRRLASMSEG